MLIKLTKDMTDSERIVVENTNNQYLRDLITTHESGNVDGWDYVKLGGGLKICSTTVWCDNVEIDAPDAGMYYNSKGIDFPEYPTSIGFSEIPSTHIDLIDADTGHAYPCFIQKDFRGHNTLLKPPSVWLYATVYVTLGHPVFRVTAWGY